MRGWTKNFRNTSELGSVSIFSRTITIPNHSSGTDLGFPRRGANLNNIWPNFPATKWRKRPRRGLGASKICLCRSATVHWNRNRPHNSRCKYSSRENLLACLKTMKTMMLFLIKLIDVNERQGAATSAGSLQVCGALNILKLTTDLTKTNDSGASWPFSVHNSFVLDRHP